MRSQLNPLRLLADSVHAVRRLFPGFGPNKSREIARLLFEISKRDRLNPEKLLGDIDLDGNFDHLKAYLLKRRYPYSHSTGEFMLPYLPEARIVPEYEARPLKKKFYPRKIFIEKAAVDSVLAKRAKRHFPRAQKTEISSLKDLLSSSPRFSTRDYNKRRDTLYIVSEKFDFLKPCPCTKGAVGCRYNILNTGFGCIYDCAYCYLQEYANIPGIALPANLDDFLSRLTAARSVPVRIGSGEFSDSLMLDGLTGHAAEIVSALRNVPRVTFEFKTKSDSIDGLLKAEHGGNIVVGWSLNPQPIIDKNEALTVSLAGRFSAAKKCARAGYRLAFHFDPVFHFPGWERLYKNLVDALFTAVSPSSVAWISIGTFRFKPEAKKIIESRFPSNEILDEELLPGYDGKLRYPYSTRYAVYSRMLKLITARSGNVPVYLCMEESRMWKDLRITPPF